MPVPNGDELVLKNHKDPKTQIIQEHRQRVDRLIPVECLEQPERMIASWGWDHPLRIVLGQWYPVVNICAWNLKCSCQSLLILKQV